MTYRQAIRYLAAFINYEHTGCWSYARSFKLKRFRFLLSSLGNPHLAVPCVHVAGSKGKGSTCAFIASILREAGLTVGLYTSPHLADARERIRILRPCPSRQLGGNRNVFEGMITKQALARQVQRLTPFLGRVNKSSRFGRLSFFEAYTAIAFSYFHSSGIDIAVLETGLGGRLDATNVVSPLVSVITPVNLEHTDLLGNTIAAIAREKAAIIKKGSAAAVSAPQEQEARKTIGARCKKVHVPLYEVGRDITYGRRGDGYCIRGLLNEYTGLRPRLIGSHQLENASAAVAAVEVLSCCGIDVGQATIVQGINHCLWPGRCEILDRSPFVIVDAAHTRVSARSLAATLKGEFRYKRLILVIGISGDKDIAGICRILSPLADYVIVTKSDNPRAADPLDIARHWWGKELSITYCVSDAVRLARSIAVKGDAIVATGSVFVVGEFRDAYKRFH